MRTGRPYRVRFHLVKGAHFMHWQVKDLRDETVTYFDPEHVNIIMENCFLRNQKATAEKIHSGQSKTVCAWVEAEDVAVIARTVKITKGHHLSYNPRVTPNWRIDNEDSIWHDENIDGHEFNTIVSSERKLWSFGVNKKHQ